MKGILLSLGILIPTILPSQIRLVPFPGIFSTYIGAHLSKRQFCLRPLSRGPFFNQQLQKQKMENTTSFRPLSWGLFFNRSTKQIIIAGSACFRPLSWGLFFNWKQTWMQEKELSQVFVPFLGDFFSIAYYCQCMHYMAVTGFSSPFLGTFFQSWVKDHFHWILQVFVPFLGDFFSIACLRSPSPSALASAFAAGMGESLHQALSFGDEMPISPVRTGIGGDLQ